METKYKVTKKVVEFEVELTLSYEEVKTLRNSLDELGDYRRGLCPGVHELRDLFNRIINVAEK